MSIGIDQLIYQALLDADSRQALYEIDDPAELLSALTPTDPSKYGGYGKYGTEGVAPATVVLPKVAMKGAAGRHIPEPRDGSDFRF